MFLIPGLTVTEVGLLAMDETQRLDGHTNRKETKITVATLDRSQNTLETDKPRQAVGEEEEKEGMLVAGLHLQQEPREKHSAHGRESEEKKAGNEELEVESVKNAKEERGDGTAASSLTPPLSTTAAQTKFPNKEPATASRNMASTEAPDPPAGPTVPEGQGATPEPSHQLSTKHTKTQPTIYPHKSRTDTMKNVTEPAGRSQTAPWPRSNTELTAMQRTAPPARAGAAKPSAETQLAAVVAASVKQVKGNRTGGRKEVERLKEQKRKKDNRTQKLATEEDVAAPTHFPYFLDDYCPPECACYGR